MTQPERKTGAQAASTFKTVAQNYQSGIGCALAFITVPIALVGNWLGFPGWLMVVLILGVIFTGLGSQVMIAYIKAREEHQKFMSKRSLTPQEEER